MHAMRSKNKKQTFYEYKVFAAKAFQRRKKEISSLECDSSCSLSMTAA